MTLHEMFERTREEHRPAIHYHPSGFYTDSGCVLSNSLAAAILRDRWVRELVYSGKYPLNRLGVDVANGDATIFAAYCAVFTEDKSNG